MTTRHQLSPDESAALYALAEKVGSLSKLAALIPANRITLWRIATGRMRITSELVEKIETLAVLYAHPKVFQTDTHQEKKEWVTEQIQIAERAKLEANSKVFLSDLRNHLVTKNQTERKRKS
jgi:hypothetical protein